MAIRPVRRLLSNSKRTRFPVRYALAILAGATALLLLIMAAAALFSLRYRLPDPSLMLVDRHEHFIASVQNGDSLFGFWPLPDTLPEKAVQLAIAAEDRRFRRHSGVDLKAIARALYDNTFTSKPSSGASTIAMQVARIQEGHPRSLFFKLEEAFTALFITLQLGREGVMRRYLTIAPYGNRISGINYAARRYFRKPLDDCTWAEMAVLTALPKAPGRMNIYRKSGVKRALRRARTILDRSVAYGMIDSMQYRGALTELDHIRFPRRERRRDNMLHAIHAVGKDLLHDRVQLHLNPANPTVRLSIDGTLQDSVAEIAMKYMDSVRTRFADNMAVLILDRATGAVRCYIGSDYYFDTRNAGGIDYVQTARSTGSLLKPFIYSFGMEWNGYTAATLLTDIGLFFGDGKKPYITENYDRHYLGPVLYQCALANSRNVPAIQVLQDVGLPLAYRKMVSLSLTPDDGKADYYGLGLAVGNLYTSLWKLCTAYLTLANEGKKMTPGWLYSQVSTEPDTQIIARDVTGQIQHILSDPQLRLPSFPRGSFLEYPFPVAVKTGTSRGYRDAWTIGWSDTYLAGVWIGRHDNQPMNGVSGFDGAAPLLRNILLFLHADRAQGLENSGFPPPKEYKPFRIDNLTGERADPASPYTSTVWLKPGTEPLTSSTILRWMLIDKRNGLLASEDCPPSVTEMRQMSVLPAIFKDWAEKQGIPLAPDRYSPLCDGTGTIPDYKISVITPQNGSRLYIDPEMPSEMNTLTLNCQVTPRVNEVLWFVDGKEYEVVPFPYTVAWKIAPGKHLFQVQVPYTPCKSGVVSVEVY